MYSIWLNDSPKSGWSQQKWPKPWMFSLQIWSSWVQTRQPMKFHKYMAVTSAVIASGSIFWRKQHDAFNMVVMILTGRPPPLKQFFICSHFNNMLISSEFQGLGSYGQAAWFCRMEHCLHVVIFIVHGMKTSSVFWGLVTLCDWFPTGSYGTDADDCCTFCS